jgi:polysaccharide biosynthesis/export protein
LTVLDAIALAGGFREWAKTKSIYVLRARAGNVPEKIPFNYKKVIKGDQSDQNIQLKPQDTIVVP